jgi:hypothetical protein
MAFALGGHEDVVIAAGSSEYPFGLSCQIDIRN